MRVVTATELSSLAGRPPSSSNPPGPSPAIPDEEALSTSYIPADGLSACLITARRILVTAGATEDDRVLPFSVVRYLDLSPAPAWTKPHRLRSNASDIPVPRVEHSLTYVPTDARLYLFGGMKVAPDLGDICKTIFAFDPRNNAWRRVDPSAAARQPDNPGPRYAHSAVFAELRARRARPNARPKPVPSLLVFGGYSSFSDHVPRSDVHALDVRSGTWGACRAGGSAPRRAYHAAAVTKSQRFMVVHGGNHSDDNDASVISDALFVLDLTTSRWSTPSAHPASEPPPAPRRRHSLVNGVGRHDGWLILYGGHLHDGNFSGDMYLCRIIEPAGDEPVGVVWEKVLVRTSVHRPRQTGANAWKSRTVAGGCLVPIPKLRKYILLGGRGELGLRHVPLLLDPYESDEIALSQSVPVEEEAEEEEELAPIRERAAAVTRSSKMRTVRSKGVEESEESEEGDIVFDMLKNTARTVPTRPTRRARSAVSTPGDKPSSTRRTPSASVTPSERSPNPSLPVGGTGDTDNRRPPTTNVNGPVAVRLRLRSATKKKVESSPGGAELMNASRKRPRRGEKKHISPPTKRGRSLAPEGSDDIAPLDFGDDNGGEAVEINGSADKALSRRSEFLSASELARKGKKAGRGRGRGRGRGGATTRARSADDRAEERRREALEKLNAQNEERVAYLEAENQDLSKEVSELKKDNHVLNEQQKRLLEEVRSCHVRENARKNNTATAVGAHARKQNGSAPGSQVENNGRPTSSVTETDSLKATITELRLEVARKTADQEGLAATAQDLQEEKRDVQKELSMMKNKVERSVIDRDSYHHEMKELRKELVVMTKDKEAAGKRAEKAEEELVLEKREVALLKADLRVQHQRQQDGKLELSSADKMMKTVRGQLAEAAKRSDDVEARERQVKADLEKAEERNGFLQQQLDDAHAGNRKLADEKIEISSELESMRIELHRNIKECSAALKDVQKSREALERERLKHVNEDVGGDYVRMRAEVERTKKECSVLRARCERFGTLKDILPKIQAITDGVSAVLASDKEGEDVEVALSQARREARMNGMVEGQKANGGTENGSQRDQHGNAEPAPNAGYADEESSANQKNPPVAQAPQEDPVTIPDSDDADEP